MYSLKSILYESLKNYRHMRPYSHDEIEVEVDEFHNNEYTKNRLKGLWSKKDATRNSIKTAPYKFPSEEELKKLQNSDVGDILELPNEDRMKRAIELASGYHKDWKSIVDGLRKNTKFPPPVIVRDKFKNLYLLGGNTRLMLGVAMGYNLPVKIVDFKKEIK